MEAADQIITLVASVSLTDDPWQFVGEGEVMAIFNGQRIASGTGAEEGSRGRNAIATSRSSFPLNPRIRASAFHPVLRLVGGTVAEAIESAAALPQQDAHVAGPIAAIPSIVDRLEQKGVRRDRVVVDCFRWQLIGVSNEGSRA